MIVVECLMKDNHFGESVRECSEEVLYTKNLIFEEPFKHQCVLRERGKKARKSYRLGLSSGQLANHTLLYG